MGRFQVFWITFVLLLFDLIVQPCGKLLELCYKTKCIVDIHLKMLLPLVVLK